MHRKPPGRPTNNITRFRSNALPEMDRRAARRVFSDLIAHRSNDNIPESVLVRLRVLAKNRLLPLPVITVTIISILITAASAIAHNLN
jgi:hypothetical protein